MSAPTEVEPRAGGRRFGRVAGCCALAAVALAVAWFGWVRHLAYFEVRHVTVVGLTAKDPPRLRRALEAQGRSMTTLAVDRDRLELVTADYPAIRSVDAVADLPDRLTIRVRGRRAVAALAGPGGADPVAVAADGTLLRERERDDRLGRIAVGSAPRGDQVHGRVLRRLVSVAATAPPSLHPRITRIEQRARLGTVVRLRNGPEVRMGAQEAPVAWAVAARVLAQRSARGASYLDVRRPERPVAGGFAAEIGAPEPPEEVPSSLG